MSAIPPFRGDQQTHAYRQGPRGRGFRRMIPWVVGAFAFAQVTFPTGMTPVDLLGRTVAIFHEHLMQVSRINALEIKRCEGVAAGLADLEARQADALGNCIWAIVIEGGSQFCRSAVQSRFAPSIAQAKADYAACRK